MEVTACPPGFTSTTSVLNGLFECRCNNGHRRTRILSCNAKQKTVILQVRYDVVHAMSAKLVSEVKVAVRIAYLMKTILVKTSYN